MPKYTLLYFPFANRGEPIRLAFVLGGIPFTNRSVSFQEFGELKPTLKTGQLPLLEVEDDEGKTTKVSQSQAILRCVGKLGGLYPTNDELLAAQVDEAMAIVDDMTEPLAMSVQGAVNRCVHEEKEWTKEEKLGIRSRIITKFLPKYLSVLSNMLTGDGKEWLVGDSVTIADLRLYQFSIWIECGILDGVPSTLLGDEYPLIQAHTERIRELPQVKAWYEKHQKPYDNFDYAP